MARAALLEPQHHAKTQNDTAPKLLQKKERPYNQLTLSHPSSRLQQLVCHDVDQDHLCLI